MPGMAYSCDGSVPGGGIIAPYGDGMPGIA
jgi:hypothetical protein